MERILTHDLWVHLTTGLPHTKEIFVKGVQFTTKLDHSSNQE